MHIPATTWSPPARSASVVPSSLALTDATYNLVHSPTASVDYLYTQGYYSSTTWYQPFYASSYALFPRYGKADYIGAYCA